MPLTKVASTMVGGGTGQAFAPNTPIFENTQAVTASYTITSGSNALSAGPVTVNNNVVVTIPDGSVWSII